MKGVIFTEFMELVEEQYSIETAEEILARTDLFSEGAYTSVGTYDHRELLTLFAELSHVSGTPIRQLMLAYGRYLFSRFAVLYPKMFEGVTSALDFLEVVETHIYSEVRKLYPDALLPTFESTRINAHSLDVVYQSARPLADMAEALIVGCLEHFGDRFTIERESADNELGRATRFRVRCQTEVSA